MKKYAFAALIALCSAPVLAQGGFSGPNATAAQPTTNNQQGGFSGPDISLTTVNKITSMSDDAWVMLQGNIVQQVGHDTYTFRDNTGTVTVEIDQKRWQGLNVTPQDRVQLKGEVDKDWNRLEVDVKEIRKMQ